MASMTSVASLAPPIGLSKLRPATSAKVRSMIRNSNTPPRPASQKLIRSKNRISRDVGL